MSEIVKGSHVVYGKVLPESKIKAGQLWLGAESPTVVSVLEVFRGMVTYSSAYKHDHTLLSGTFQRKYSLILRTI